MIVLAGAIGAGKSSLTKMIGEAFSIPSYYESVDNNEVLPLFYANPKKYAFLLQIYFLNQRFEGIKEASQQKEAVLDRSIYEDALLFELISDLGNASKEEVTVYKSLLKNMMEEQKEAPYVKKPELLIHIKIPFETMLQRIQKRGREYEQIEYDPTLYDYYQELNRRYQTFYANYHESPKMEIDGDKYNFVEDEEAKIVVLQMIQEKLAEIRS